MNIVTTLTVVRSQIEAVAKVTNRARERIQGGRKVVVEYAHLWGEISTGAVDIG